MMILWCVFPGISKESRSLPRRHTAGAMRGAMRIVFGQLRKHGLRWRDLARDGWKIWRTFG